MVSGFRREDRRSFKLAMISSAHPISADRGFLISWLGVELLA